MKFLVDIGWSEYESRTYSALALQGTSTASIIAKKSGVPSNRIYQILDKLASKGYVKRLAGAGLTTRYEPINIKDFLNQEMRISEKKYERVLEAVDELMERHDATTPLKALTVYGGKEVSLTIKEMFEYAESHIYMFMDTLIELKYGDLIEDLNIKGENPDMMIKILTSPRGINDKYEREVFRELIDIDVRVTEDALSTILLLVDEKQLLFVSYAQLTEELTPRDYFGVYLRDQKTVRMFLRLFNLAWESAVLPPAID